MKKTMPVDGKFELMTLPYAPEALEPVISANTLGFHHGKHLLTYVNNLNAALPGSGLEDKSLEDVVLNAQGGMLNNAGQILNHNLYFGQFMAPKADNAPTGRLAEAIDAAFGSFEAFKEAFAKAGATLFGSGWAWLSADAEGKLVKQDETDGKYYRVKYRRNQFKQHKRRGGYRFRFKQCIGGKYFNRRNGNRHGNHNCKRCGYRYRRQQFGRHDSYQ